MAKRIFVSATSADLGEHRREISDLLVSRGYLPVDQDHFVPDYREVLETLRSKIESSDAVICLVGSRYGEEPRQRPKNAPRRSYTQLEYEIAVELGKPVFLFVSTEPSTCESDEPEEKQKLQHEYVRRLSEQDHVRLPFKSSEDLKTQVALIDFSANTQVSQALAVLLRVEIVAPERLDERRQIESIVLPWQKSIESVCKRYRGEPHVETDSTCVLQFDSAEDATNAALRLRDVLGRYPWQEQSPEFVYGVHLGEVTRYRGIDGGPALRVGQALDLAEVLARLAHPGQILLSRSAFDLARQTVSRVPEGVDDSMDLEWRSHGRFLIAGSGTAADRTSEESIEVCEVDVQRDLPFPMPQTNDYAVSADSVEQARMRGWRPSVGQLIPTRENWQIERKLGEGGFGEVWLARDQATKFRRVFKFCFDVERLRSFKREVALFKILRGALEERPDIVRLLEVRLDNPPFYLESEFVEAGNLMQWAEDEGGIGRVPLVERVRIIREVAQTAAAAHSAGVIHRDLKPTNIFMSKDAAGVWHPMLADFGIGALADHAVLEQQQITHATIMRSLLAGQSSDSGTRMYKPQDKETDTPRSDVYSIGVMLFQTLAEDFSQPSGPGWEDKIPNAATGQEVALALLKSDVRDAIHVDSEQRIQTAEELAGRLGSLDERVRSEIARRERERVEMRNRRLRQLLRGSVAALAVISTLAGFALFQWRSAQMAIRDRDDAIIEKDAALVKERQARAETQKTNSELRRTRRDIALRFARSQDQQAIRAMENGDTPVALAWLAESLKTWSDDKIGDPEAQRHALEITQLRIAGLLNRMPRLSELILADGPILNAEMSEDGAKLAVLSDGWSDRSLTLRVWDIDQARPITAALPVEGSSTSRARLKLSPDGNLIAAANSTALTTRLHLWDVHTSRRLSPPVELGGPLLAMEFNETQDKLATVTTASGTMRTLGRTPPMSMTAGRLQIWSVPELKSEQGPVPIVDQGAVLNASFCRKRWSVVVSAVFASPQLAMWDLHRLENVDLKWLDDDEKRLASITHGVINVDGSRLAINTSAHGIEMFDLEEKQRVGNPSPTQIMLSDLRFGRNGHPLVSIQVEATNHQESGDVREEIVIHSVNQFRPVGNLISTGGKVNSITRVYDRVFGPYIAAGMQDATVPIWTVAGTPGTGVLSHSDSVSYVEFTGGGKLATCGLDGCIRIWEPSPADRVPFRLRPFDLYANDIESESGGTAFLGFLFGGSEPEKPPYNYLGIGSAASDSAARFDVAKKKLELVRLGDSDEVLQSWDSERQLEWAYLSPPGDRIVSAAGTLAPSSNGNIDRFTTVSEWGDRELLPCHIRFVSSGQTQLDVADDFQGLIVAIHCDWQENRGLVISWAPDGAQLRRYDLMTGALQDVTSLPFRVVDVSFARNRIAVLYGSGACQIWEVAGDEPQSLIQPFGDFAKVRLSDNGRRLATSTSDDEVFGWATATGDWADFDEEMTVLRGRYGGIFLVDMYFLKNRFFAVGDNSVGYLWAWQPDGTYSLIREQKLDEPVRAVAADADRGLIAIANDSGKVSLFDATSLDVVIDQLPIAPAKTLFPVMMWFDPSGSHLRFISQTQRGAWSLLPYESSGAAVEPELLQVISARRVLESGAIAKLKFRGDDWEMLRGFQDRDPHWQWMYESAMRSFEQGAVEQAIQTLTSAIEISPDSALRGDLFLQRGKMCGETGDVQGYVHDMNQAEELIELVARDRLELASALIVDDPERSIELATGLIRELSHSALDVQQAVMQANAHRLLARSRAQLGDWDQAVAARLKYEESDAWRAIQQLNPNAATSVNANGALLFYEAGDSDSAAQKCHDVATGIAKSAERSACVAAAKSCGVLRLGEVDWSAMERTLRAVPDRTLDETISLVIAVIRQGKSVPAEDWTTVRAQLAKKEQNMLFDSTMIQLLEAIDLVGADREKATQLRAAAAQAFDQPGKQKGWLQRAVFRALTEWYDAVTQVG